MSQEQTKRQGGGDGDDESGENASGSGQERREKLGEDVAAAVVLREGVDATPSDLQEFAAERLANFKVPRTVLVVDEIPKGPTGKLRRIGLAEQMGIA